MARGGLAAGGMAAFAAGYGETLLKAGKGLLSGSAGEAPAHATRGNALTPEFRIDPATGQLSPQPGQVVSMSSCLGCWTQCGVRVRVDEGNQRILRVAGNPYHPLATGNPAPMSEPVREVFARLGGDSGLEGRATACARGAAMQEQYSSPHRVLQPLKRVGPRGAGQWKTISFEELVKEVCEGGDLFGEGHVDGLRAIFDAKTLIDPDNPEYGTRVNQFVFTDAGNEGRTALIRRFTEQSFGSLNFANHGAYCGQSFRVGAGVALGNRRAMPHGKPDWPSARFGLFIGTAPAQAGNPFQRQGRELAEARARKENTLRYVVVSPILPTSSSMAAGDGNRWLAIKPATDLALVMGLIRWIMENDRYDADNLRQPGPAAMSAAGQASWTNATHLLVADPAHPRFGQFVRGTDLGWPQPPAPENATPAPAGQPPAPPPVEYVVQAEDGSLMPHTRAQPAQLRVQTTLDIPAWGEQGQAVPVASAFVMLQRAAEQHTLDEYASLCGVPRTEIEALAREFTSHGKHAVADAHGGTMSGAGFYTAYAIGLLNTLVGNLNVQGGLVLDAGPFGPFGPGPRYDFANFEGRAKPGGLGLSRNRMPYEKSSEFKRKKDSGANPYPAQAPWYPVPHNGLGSEMLASALNGYPYRAKVWFNHMANPVYAISGFRNALQDKLKDPKVLPLCVSINPFINETNAFADYIVPDTVTYESWGISVPWADVVAKSSTVRSPVVPPRVGRTASGEPINLESFLFAVARTLGMPGFGPGALKDKDGNAHDLNTAADFYLRGAANIAFAGGQPVGEASDDDLQLTGHARHRELLQTKLKPDEWRHVAMVLTRGGRFDRLEQAWKGTQLKAAHKPALPLWDEELAKMRHSMTGERLHGCPRWQPTRLAGGQPMREQYPEKDWPLLMISYKSNLMSSMSIGASRLRQVHPHNPISIHRDDAARLGLSNGQKVRVHSPGGSLVGVAIVREGIMPGAIAVEYGYGHKELGARAHTIDGQPMPAQAALGAGVNMNEIGLVDPTRGSDQPNAWVDSLSGGVVRQGLPVRVEPA
ncbi:MAG: molybdopterin dinucleotide binding domain-containing protein [Pseudomonadota bacterium]|nr:molybdopterin dinucleotide binding domain-containing protein [Pseudomonadota bacterium]